MMHIFLMKIVISYTKDVKINSEDVYIVNVKCSGAATILLSNEGILVHIL